MMLAGALRRARNGQKSVREGKTVILRRFHWIEFWDCAWLPAFVRTAMTSALGFMLRTLKRYEMAFPHFFAWAAGRSSVLDLASGSATHVSEFERWAQSAVTSSPLPTIWLSDLYPDIASFQNVKESFPNRVGFVREPVDARRVGTSRGRGLRCMFGAFHHLRPEQARQVLLDAARSSAGIFIYEPHLRLIRNIFSSFGAFFFAMIAPFCCGKFSWKRLIFSTLIPVIPLLLVHDSIVTAFRCYTQQELQEMVDSLPRNGFAWEVVRVRSPQMPILPGLCLIGRETTGSWR